MARKLYGLLVGIDAYPDSVPDLRGCVNDIEAFAAYLQSQAGAEGFDAPELKLLKSEEATRDALIRGFRGHLGQAGSKDVALFYYSGHGSQEQAPEQFWALEPDHLNETLVCYDSREPGGWDLADKELAKLIHEVARKGAHTLLILDCCHSGSGTRDSELAGTAVRKVATDTRQRPLDSFIFGEADLASLSTRNLADGSGSSGWSTLPEGRHILLAGCQDNELAKEYNADGKTWGTFSYFLRTTLQNSSRPLSYHELYSRARIAVESSVSAQRPQLEASNLDDIRQPFLGGAVLPKRSLLVTPEAGSWQLQAGAVHGIAAPVGQEATRLALFDQDAEDLSDVSQAVAQAEVREVSAQTSRLHISEGELAGAATYQAVITGLPLAALTVGLEGDPAGVELAREALMTAGPDGGASLYVREAEQPEYRLWAKDESFIITRTADDRPLVRQVTGGYTAEGAKKALAQLEHIARWAKTRDLHNPLSGLEPDAIRMAIHYEGETYSDLVPELSYRQTNGTWSAPTFKLQLVNTSEETLFCSVLALSESYAVSPGLFPSGQVKLAPGEAAWAYGGRPIPATVPDDLWQAGITERKDILKLIFSRRAFDASLLQQGKLEAPRLATRDVPKPKSALERLMARVQTREIGEEDVSEVDDWTTRALTLVTVRPQESRPIPSEGRSASLGFGVSVAPHPALKAQAKLGTLSEASRSLDTWPLPDILRDASSESEPLYFTRSRGQDPGLSTVELSQVQNAESVTKEAPLELTLDISLDEDEHLLPLAFDGEFYLPLGYAHSEGTTRGEAGGGTRVVLERLPDPANLQTRDLFGAIRILFQKFKSKMLGKAFEYPLLTTAEALANSEVRYDKVLESVKGRVAQAERILLFIHGIIGETKPLVPSVRLAKLEDGTTLQDAYDLILAFDYENLHTPIEENARLLKQRLEGVGLGAGHGKTLHIVAHSMGGLVSRWFIEREGGKDLVNHLVLVGTPSGGSPWSAIEDWATTLLAVGLNRLSAVVWPVSVLAQLVKLLENVDVSLDQMHPESDFIKNLSQSPDPHLPYTILVGNTSIIPAAQDEEADSRLIKLLKKLKLKQRSYDALTKVVFKEPNDIAVGVSSIQAVDKGRTPAPVVLEVASDHVSYFRIEAGLESLKQALVPRHHP